MEDKKDGRGGARAGSGRPKTAEDVRERRQFRASPEEYREIKQNAINEGMKTGEYVRERALKNI
jgi:hypothetical protein